MTIYFVHTFDFICNLASSTRYIVSNVMCFVHFVDDSMLQEGYSQVYASLGETNVNIQCLVCGDPPPQYYHWSFQDGQPLEGTLSDHQTLIIDKVTPQHYGNYTCKMFFPRSPEGVSKHTELNIELQQGGYIS